MSGSDQSRDREGADSALGTGERPRSLTVAARATVGPPTKPTMMERGRAYLEVARLSNAPTVISNVLTGVAIGLASHPEATVTWGTLGYLCFGFLLLYVGGMALNDWADVAFDREHAPMRPIPSGRMSRLAALLFAFGSFTEGLILTGMASTRAVIPTSILVALIIAYDLLHKRHAATVVLMGLCRGMVYVVAVVAVTDEVDWFITAPLAAGLALYVTMLTVIARGEHRPDSRMPALSGVFLAAVALAPLIVLEIAEPTWAASAAALLSIWVILAGLLLRRRQPQFKATVLRWLAGICLVDVVYLSALNTPLFASIALLCFGLTLLAHRRIPGT